MANPGWYPDPSGGQRYFDGQTWTEHHAPQPPTVGPVVTYTGPNHALHAVISLFTCGLWLPFWLVIAIIQRPKVQVRQQ